MNRSPGTAREVTKTQGVMRRARRALNRAEPFILELGAFLEAERTRRQWTLDRLALEAELHPNTVHRVLTGKVIDVEVGTVIALAQALGFTIAVLVPNRKHAA